MTGLKHSPLGECFFVHKKTKRTREEMGPRTRTHLSVLCIVAAIALLGACTPRVQSIPPDEVVFSVDPEQVGPIYENRELGFKYRPPLGWEQLEGDRLQAVLDSLPESGEDDDFALEVADIFFDTTSMSFSSIGAVGIGPGAGASDYIDAFGETLGLEEVSPADDTNAIVARMDFAVNGMPVIQFRHLRSNRITFTLLFQTDDETLIQLDYSIPADNYQTEAPKLESSIGTLQLAQ